MADKFCLKIPDFHVTFRDILHAANLRHRTNGFTSLPKEGVLRIFFALKNPTASAGYEPANLGTKGQHATSRPPKPLCLRLILIHLKTETGSFPRSCMALCVVALGKVLINISDNISAVVPCTLLQTTAKVLFSETLWFSFYFKLGAKDTPLRSDDSKHDIPSSVSMELRTVWLNVRSSSENVEISKTNRFRQKARNFSPSWSAVNLSRKRLCNGVALFN